MNSRLLKQAGTLPAKLLPLAMSLTKKRRKEKKLCILLLKMKILLFRYLEVNSTILGFSWNRLWGLFPNVSFLYQKVEE